VLAGLKDLTGVTGVRGLYGRSLSDPAVAYNPVAADDPGWTASPAPNYAGWRFRNDVSKDGYAGLMFGYAVALEHFDQADLVAEVKDRVREVADHLMAHGLQIVDTKRQSHEHWPAVPLAMDDCRAS